MFNKNFLTEYLSDEDLNDITRSVGRVENQTSGEIRICIKRNRGYLEKELTSREIAIKEFFSLKMNETTDKTGVLFFVLMEERSFEIIADEGINEKISELKWNEISDKVRIAFSEKKYLQGTLDLIYNIGEVLIKEFPLKADDKNELPNEVVLRP